MNKSKMNIALLIFLVGVNAFSEKLETEPELIPLTTNTEPQIVICDPAPSVSVPEVRETPEIYDGADVNDELNKSIDEKTKNFIVSLNTFTDKRNLLAEFNSNQNLSKWINVYNKINDYEFDYVELPENIKMIAEVSAIANSEQISILTANLTFYKKNGFNTVLFTFNCTERKLDLVSTIRIIKLFGLNVCIAYSGDEHLSTNALIDPEVLKSYIEVLAPEVDGMLIGWRRTSAHLFIQDSGFSKYIIKCAREKNKNLYIIGECYYGETGKTDSKKNGFNLNLPINSSGVAIVGVGVRGINPSKFIRNQMANSTSKKLIVVLGEKAWYNTKAKTNRTFDENFEIKERIANRWINAGCTGVIIIHGDGSNGMFDPEFTDDLTKTIFKK